MKKPFAMIAALLLATPTLARAEEGYLTPKPAEACRRIEQEYSKTEAKLPTNEAIKQIAEGSEVLNGPGMPSSENYIDLPNRRIMYLSADRKTLYVSATYLRNGFFITTGKTRREIGPFFLHDPFVRNKDGGVVRVRDFWEKLPTQVLGQGYKVGDYIKACGAKVIVVRDDILDPYQNPGLQ